MACKCNKCNSNPCGCKDHGLTTPCAYTECGVGNERCDDIQCTECVSYCGSTFRIETSSGILKVESGERLDQILQKFALMIANGIDVCTADNVHHAPYNLYADKITSTTVDIVWDGISSLSESFSVYYDTVDAPSGWTQANTNALATAVNTYTVEELDPETEYKIKVVSTFGSNTCDSVEILVTTLEA